MYHLLLQHSGFHTGFFLLGEEIFQNSNLNILLEVSGSMPLPSKKFLLQNDCPEIESGEFWQHSRLSQVCVQTICPYDVIYLKSWGGGGGES